MGSLPITFCLVWLLLPPAGSLQISSEGEELLEERGLHRFRESCFSRSSLGCCGPAFAWETLRYGRETSKKVGRCSVGTRSFDSGIGG